MTPDRDDIIVFINAARAGNLSRLLTYIDKFGADILDTSINNQGTALYLAAADGHTPCVKALIEAGASINLGEGNLTTPLMIAAWWGKLEALDTLMEAKAELDLRSTLGQTALLLAAQQNRTDCALRLIKAGADVNIPQNEGQWTPLHYAVQTQNIIVVQALLHAGARTDARTHADARSPLDFARSPASNNLEIQRILIEWENKLAHDEILRELSAGLPSALHITKGTLKLQHRVKLKDVRP